MCTSVSPYAKFAAKSAKLAAELANAQAAKRNFFAKHAAVVLDDEEADVNAGPDDFKGYKAGAYTRSLFSFSAQHQRFLWGRGCV